MTQSADISIVVPHFDDADRLRRCLAALCADPDAGDAEIVVVDNASPQNPAATLADVFPGVRFLVEPQRGAAMARNRGVAETRGAMLFFLDCDCVPAKGWIAAAAAALNGREVVGGAVTLFDETPPPRSGAEAFETVMAFQQERYVREEGFSVSANLLTWRRIFDAVGPFRPGLSEDLDWCRRATAAGFALVYAPEVAVAHPTRSDMAALSRKFHRITAETAALRRGAPLWRVTWLLRAVAMLASPLLHAPRFLRDPRLRDAGERRRGLVALAQIRTKRAVWMGAQALGLARVGG